MYVLTPDGAGGVSLAASDIRQASAAALLRMVHSKTSFRARLPRGLGTIAAVTPQQYIYRVQVAAETALYNSLNRGEYCRIEPKRHILRTQVNLKQQSPLVHVLIL